jgi:hypothetical protein
MRRYGANSGGVAEWSMAPGCNPGLHSAEVRILSPPPDTCVVSLRAAAHVRRSVSPCRSQKRESCSRTGCSHNRYVAWWVSSRCNTRPLGQDRRERGIGRNPASLCGTGCEVGTGIFPAAGAQNIRGPDRVVRYQPSKLRMWVRFPRPAPTIQSRPVSSADRASDFYPEGRPFESVTGRQKQCWL